MIETPSRVEPGMPENPAHAGSTSIDDANLFWQLERLHFPEPMTAMDYAYMAQSHDQLNWAFADYGLPVRFHYRLINHRWYYAVAPIDAAPAELQAMGERGAAKVTAAAARLDWLWHAEWLPEIREHLAFWERFDLAGADLPTLMAHFDETMARARRLWQIHFLQTMPVYVAMSEFEELCRELFGDQDALGPYRLTQGLGNATFESGRALWRLSRRAAAMPEVCRILTEEPASRVMAALRATPTGREFAAELAAYLNQWGKRGGQLGLSQPSWIEDPMPAIKQLADYLGRQDRDLEAEFAGLVEARERALAEARAALSAYPKPVREQFEAARRTAEIATVISEDHNHLIDFQSSYEIRRVVLAVGARLVDAGALNATTDAFDLSPDELRATVAAKPMLDQRQMVSARQVSVAQARAASAPLAFGEPPAGPPPGDPVGRALGKFFGAPPPPTVEPNIVRGHSGSRGVVRGPARVTRSLAEATRLQPGDILVAPTTAPAWTPFFATLAAVVTDAGGVLSHSAVVAREYGLPAVVGTVNGSERIRDGQLVEVDGGAGVVRLL